MLAGMIHGTALSVAKTSPHRSSRERTMTLSVSRWRRTAPVVRDVEAGLQLIHGLTQAGMIGTSKRRNTSARSLPFVVTNAA